MKKSKFFLLLLTCVLMSTTALAQKRAFKGVVLDEANEPIIGASVVQKGTSNGAATDLDGNFTVNVEPGTTLVVSYIGYETVEVRAAEESRGQGQ